MQNKATLIEGCKLAFENAERLFKAATTLAESGEYPIANSLLILAAEEASKAASIKLSAMFKMDAKMFRDIFKKHEVKIDMIKAQTGMSELMSQMFEIELGPLLNHVKNGEEMTNETFTRLAKEGRENYINKIINDGFTLEETDWWETVSIVKQEGFYLWYNGGKWKSPTSITEEQYKKTFTNVTNYFDRAKRVCESDFNDKDYQEFKEMAKKMILKSPNCHENKPKP